MDQLVNFIIRPPRAFYCPEDDLLDQEFILKGRWFQRKDLEVTNSRGKKLQCSHYKPLVAPEGKALPCVVYCHGNSGCRADASEAAVILLPSNITVFALDFSGSGLSEGEHVTLGWNEKDDLRAVVNFLRTDAGVSCIGLWGRSMGAVTSLMYGAEDPSIAGMVLDSPFSNLVDLMMELVDTYRYPIPKFTAVRHLSVLGRPLAQALLGERTPSPPRRVPKKKKEKNGPTSEARTARRRSSGTQISFSPSSFKSKPPLLVPSLMASPEKQRAKLRKGAQPQGLPSSSLHERHCKVNQAQAEKMRRWTFLPYRCFWDA